MTIQDEIREDEDNSPYRTSRLLKAILRDMDRAEYAFGDRALPLHLDSEGVDQE